AEINDKLQQYREDNDVMLIADLPDFLRLIIDESDTPYIYEKVGSFFDHYLIDEFQDTSSFQWNNFKPLMKDAADAGQRNLVVGDAKQSIYRWRGGDWRLLESGISEVVGHDRTEQMQLDTNWRSSEVIVRFNNWFFSNMREAVSRYFTEGQKASPDGIDAVMSLYESVAQKPAREDQAGLVSFEFLDTEEEYTSAALARTIEIVEQLQGKGYQLRDMAILTRTQYQGKVIADGFIAHKRSQEAKEDCKYDVVSSEALYLYSSHVVKMLISLLTWLNHEKNSIALSEWLYEYRRFVKREAVTDGAVFADIDRWRQWVPSSFLRQKDYLKTVPLYELVESLIRTFELNTIKSELTYLQGFQDAILDFSKTQRGDIPVFLSWWENVRKQRAIQIADENDAVKVMTIHKAKGLEFPVVIVPFLNWKLDHEVGLQDEILWLEAGDHAPLKRLPVVPLKYSSKLRDTYWSEAYLQEHLSAFIDSINLLYVAFTRPTTALYVMGEVPKGKMNHIGEFCQERLMEAEDWQPDGRPFVRGALPPGKPKDAVVSEYGLDHYMSENWRGKVSLQMKGAVALSELSFDAQQYGTALHAKLARVQDLSSLEDVQDDEVRAIVQHPEVRFYFDQPTTVLCEYPILMPGGSYYRIDRIIQKEGVWYVIDYKTGQPKTEDETQVKRYQQILLQMGYENPQGRIIYTDPITVKSI
ncbi:MAG: 3'-5' exonuclease, partial [Bacteroidota bacterium]